MSYLYDELTAEEHSSREAHLAVCPDCKTRVSDWRTARKNLDAWQLPARLARVPLQRPLVRWAAAAALMIGFGFGVGRFATPATANAGKINVFNGTAGVGGVGSTDLIVDLHGFFS